MSPFGDDWAGRSARDEAQIERARDELHKDNGIVSAMLIVLAALWTAAALASAWPRG